MSITKGFGFTLDTQTGHVERWAAVDTASAQSHIDAARERMNSAGVPTLAECAVKAAVLIAAIKGVRPSGSQCVQCQHSARDCSGLDFASMRPAGKPDADGVQRVACSDYGRSK